MTIILRLLKPALNLIERKMILRELKLLDSLGKLDPEKRPEWKLKESE